MNDIIDTAATVATGGILAREVDRIGAHPVDGSGHDASGACANCGAVLTGAYCHACGQHGHVHRTAGALVHDLLHGVFHFEGRFWATLPKLAFKPGDLTRRYARGERAKFVSPMAMFLFSVFLLFAVVANLPGWSIGNGDPFGRENVSITVERARAALAQERRKADVDIARMTKRLAERRAETPADAGEIAAAESRLDKARRARAEIARTEGYLPASGTKPPELSTGLDGDAGNWLQKRWEHARENPKLVLYKMKTSAYKYSWALIPLSLPFIWLLFPFRRDVGLYDHAVFATYSLSFMSLLVVTLGLLGFVGVPSWLLVLAVLGVPPFHIYRQLKGAYIIGRFGALWRTIVMLFAIGLIVSLFSAILLYMGVAD